MSLMEETDPDFLQENPRPAVVVGEDIYVHLTSLTPEQVQLLDQFYQQLLPEYAAHVLQYETARERARKSCNMCLLPPRDKYYQSPDQNAVFFKKVRVRETQTGRTIEYVSELTEKKNTASLICTESQAGCQRFGIVTKMFKHTFEGEPRYLALAQFYDISDYDKDNHLWYVISPSRSIKSEIFLLETLSRPLVKAVDGDILWVLNHCKM